MFDEADVLNIAMFGMTARQWREEIENLENYNNLISHIEDLHKLQDCSMVSEDISGNIQIPF